VWQRTVVSIWMGGPDACAAKCQGDHGWGGKGLIRLPGVALPGTVQ
jgi:hypothetical protein